MEQEKLGKMVMRLFALKGKTGYNEVDIDAWVDYLKDYEERDIARAFNACIQKEGFFEIKHVLDELKPNDKEIAVDEWERCMEVARAGGQGFDKLSPATKKSLKLAGGLQKLRITESEYTKNHMRETFIDTFSSDVKEIAFDSQNKTYGFIEQLGEKLSLK